MSAEVKRYEMRFVPYNSEGRLKRNAPMPGLKGGIDDGDVCMLPLDQRWETWWELVNEDSVDPKVLERNTKDREAFMVNAKAAELERAKNLRSYRVPII